MSQSQRRNETKAWLTDYGALSEVQREEVDKIYLFHCFPNGYRAAVNERIIAQTNWSTKNSGQRLLFVRMLKSFLEKSHPALTSCPNHTGLETKYVEQLTTCFKKELYFTTSVLQAAVGSVANLHNYPIYRVPPATVRADCSGSVEFDLDQLLPLQLQSLDVVRSIKAKYESQVNAIQSAIGAWQRKQQRLANESGDGIGSIQDDDESQSFYSELRKISVDAQNVYDQLYKLIAESTSLSQQEEAWAVLRDETIQLVIVLTRVCFVVVIQPKRIQRKGNELSVTASLLAGWQRDKAPQAIGVKCSVLQATPADFDDPFDPNAQQQQQQQQRDDDFSLSVNSVVLKRSGDAAPFSRTNRAKRCASAMEETFAAKLLPEAYHAELSGAKLNKGNGDRDPGVAALKYALVFEAEWPLHIEQCSINSVTLRCKSLPVCCTVHSNQDVRASGTIFWDNAFAGYMIGRNCKCWNSAEGGVGVSRAVLGDGNDKGGVHHCRSGFEVPEEVGWAVFKRELMRWFKAGAGCELSDQHMEFIGQCVAQTNSNGVPTVSQRRVLNEVLRKPLSDMCFWDWIFCVRELLREAKDDKFFMHLWKEGYVYFANQEQAVKMLREKYTNPDELAESMIIRVCSSDYFVKKKKPSSSTIAASKRSGIVTVHGFKDPIYSTIGIRQMEPCNSDDLKSSKFYDRFTSPDFKRVNVYPKSKNWNKLTKDFFEAEPEINFGYAKVRLACVIAADHGFSGLSEVGSLPTSGDLFEQ